MTNRELAATDPVFNEACRKAGVYPSRAQFLKFKYRRGIAYLTMIGRARNGDPLDKEPSHQIKG